VKKSYTLRNVQIFDVGTHKGIKFDINAVKSLFGYTKKLIEQLKPYLSVPGTEPPHFGIGHRRRDGGPNVGDELALRSDLPALGWFSNLRLQGTKIITDITEVPRQVYEAIQAKRYARISPEITFNYRNAINGEIVPMVIKAAKVIGVTPEIKTLEDVVALGEESVTYLFEEAGTELENIEAEEIETEEEEMDPKDIKKALEGVKVESTEDALGLLNVLMGIIPENVRKEMHLDEMLTDEGNDDTPVSDDQGEPKGDDVAALKTQLADRDKRIAELEKSTKTLTSTVDNVTRERHLEKVGAEMAEHVNKGVIEPKVAESVLAIVKELPMSLTMEFREGEDTKKTSVAERLISVLGQQSKRVDMKEVARGGKSEEGETSEAQYESGKKI